MSYIYSNRLCEEALRIMNSADSLETRLTRAFAEMGVSKYGDTSDDIWKKWKNLEKRYFTVTTEIHNLKKEGFVIENTPEELKQFGESLIQLIGEWTESNNNEINHGRLRKHD